MKRLTRLAMPLMLALILVMGASADTISFDSSFNIATNAPQNISVNFDLFGSIPAGSTINSLTTQLLIGSQLVSSGTATNNDTLAGTTFNFVLSGFQVNLSIPGFGNFLFLGTNRNEFISVGVAPGPGNVASFGTVTDSIAGVLGSTNSGGCLTGSCTYTVDKDGLSFITSDNAAWVGSVSNSVVGTLRFTYDFTPPNEEPDPDPIPEPTTILLVGGALLGLGLFRRR